LCVDLGSALYEACSKQALSRNHLGFNRQAIDRYITLSIVICS